MTARNPAHVLLTALALAVGLWSAESTAQITYTYNNVQGRRLATFVTTLFSADQEFILTNNTGRTWDGFRLRLAADGDFGPYDFPRFTDLGGDSQIYYGPGSTIFRDRNGDAYGYNEIMLVFDFTVADGDDFHFHADILSGIAPEGMTELRIYGRPRAAAKTVARQRDVSFMYGDGNDDGEADITDVVNLFEDLFSGTDPKTDLPRIRCQNAMNLNGDAHLDAADAVNLLQALFLGRTKLPAPLGVCSRIGDKDVADLGCDFYTHCGDSRTEGTTAVDGE